MNSRINSLFVLTALVLTVAAAPAGAQDESPVSFGVKLGLNISDFRGDDDIESWGELLDWKAGFCGGLFMSYAVNDRFSIQPELLYTMKGMKIGFLGFSATWNLDYIEIPVLAVYNFPVWGRANPFIFAGPAIGFNVRSEAGASYEDWEESVDIKEFTNSVDFSLALGAGLHIPVGGQEIIFDFRWVPGLSKVYNEDFEQATGASADIFNDTFSFLFGYEF